MKKRTEKSRNPVKGIPGAVALSILIHTGFFLLAGALVIFTVVTKEEQVFDPPKTVERPRMKLRKPQVKVRKTSKPKPAARIVTTAKRSSMPVIELPGISDMGESLDGVFSGMEMFPELGEATLFGNALSIGNDFVGTFYDLKRDNHGRSIPYSSDEYRAATRRFLKGGWKSSALAQYYKSPKKRYTSTFMIPPTLSALVPAVFGEPETEGIYWVTHYTGQLVHQNGITFRFIGRGDGTMAVRVNGEVVLINGWLEPEGLFWRPSSADHLKYWLGNGKASAGDWITLEPGMSVAMEVFMVEGGGQGCFMLAVEEKDAKYEMRTIGGPIFPAFRTSEVSRDMLDVIYRSLVTGEVSLTNGPVFRDYSVEKAAITSTAEANEPPGPVQSKPRPRGAVLRTWTNVDGRILEAEFIVVIGDRVVLRTSGGKQLRWPLVQLSDADRKYITLTNPPEFDIEYSAGTKPVYTIIQGSSSGIRFAHDYSSRVKLKQHGTVEYNHTLFIEFFAIGKEIDGDRYILLDRQESVFTPAAENLRSHEFGNRTVRLSNFAMHNQHRGEKPFGYLVTLTDSRGEIIAHKASNAWLYENMENLKKMPVGAYMDKTCSRVFPTGPKRTLY